MPAYLIPDPDPLVRPGAIQRVEDIVRIREDTHLDGSTTYRVNDYSATQAEYQRAERLLDAWEVSRLEARIAADQAELARLRAQLQEEP